MKAGKRIFAWHHWCGLIAGIILLEMSITGSILVFADEIGKGYRPQIAIAGTANIPPGYDTSFVQLWQQYPGWEIRIYDQPAATRPIIYELRKKGVIKHIYMHPVSGKLLYTDDNVQNQLQRTLLTLHYTLFTGKTGTVVVLVIGILFFICIVTGIYIYRKAFVKVLLFKVRLNRKSRHAFYSSLHRLTGVYALLFMLLIVTTGVSISIRIISAPSKGGTAAEKTVSPFSLDRAVASIKMIQPDFSTGMIRLRGGDDAVEFRGRFKGDPFYYGAFYSVIFYNGETGRITKTEPLRNQPSMKKWWSIVTPLHFGNYGGLPVKIVYSILGLTPGLLSVTGFAVWRKRNRLRKRSSRS
ncbi:PepSY-associated TM helix domain-containing protein [Niabella hirudinis]|uniref:PepSY-associated TM helix domain-containing protein n=1 Tax=Niabella hirudinis TaxID=1285929 RepID=UPI003EBA61B5